MGDEAVYTVEYLDEEGETCKYLKREGEVKISYPNGDTFEGIIGKDLLRHGKGTYTWMKIEDEGEPQVLATYTGMYRQGQMEGIGKMIFPSGDSYHGEWVQNKMTGEGSYIYANGDIYSGSFQNGIRVGKGTYEYAKDKSVLFGNWNNDTITDGKWTLKEGGSVLGSFEKGKPINSCILDFPNGLQQRGEYIKVKEQNRENEEVEEHKFIGGEIVRVR